MANWSFPLLYILIIGCLMLLFANLTGSIWGIPAGLLIGHTAATFILSRLPGFWGDK